ncbi:MAG TPA: DUF1127 domain-containing protein [Aestuariivirgaceae bacterium]
MSELTTGRSFDHMFTRASARSAGFDLISDFIGVMVDRLVLRVQRERTRRALLDLDDRMLADIGLSRMDLRGGNFADLNRINWSGRGHPSGL